MALENYESISNEQVLWNMLNEVLWETWDGLDKEANSVIKNLDENQLSDFIDKSLKDTDWNWCTYVEMKNHPFYAFMVQSSLDLLSDKIWKMNINWKNQSFDEYFKENRWIDNKYWNWTFNAVRAFQKKYWLSVDWQAWSQFFQKICDLMRNVPEWNDKLELSGDNRENVNIKDISNLKLNWWEIVTDYWGAQIWYIKMDWETPTIISNVKRKFVDWDRVKIVGKNFVYDKWEFCVISEIDPVVIHWNEIPWNLVDGWNKEDDSTDWDNNLDAEVWLQWNSVAEWIWESITIENVSSLQLVWWETVYDTKWNRLWEIEINKENLPIVKLDNVIKFKDGDRIKIWDQNFVYNEWEFAISEYIDTEDVVITPDDVKFWPSDAPVIETVDANWNVNNLEGDQQLPVVDDEVLTNIESDENVPFSMDNITFDDVLKLWSWDENNNIMFCDELSSLESVNLKWVEFKYISEDPNYTGYWYKKCFVEGFSSEHNDDASYVFWNWKNGKIDGVAAMFINWQWNLWNTYTDSNGNIYRDWNVLLMDADKELLSLKYEKWHPINIDDNDVVWQNVEYEWKTFADLINIPSSQEHFVSNEKIDLDTKNDPIDDSIDEDIVVNTLEK